MTSASLWYPHVTVATIVEENGHFLMVYEKTESGERYNQPAGHLEKNETLVEAAVRETKEETAFDIEVTGFLRINQYTSPANGLTYVRVTLTGEVLKHDKDSPLDDDIIAAKWLSRDFIAANREKLRSPVVLSDIEFYRTHSPLALEYIAHIKA